MGLLRWRRGRERTGRERGAAALEFALIGPILITVLLGITEAAFLLKDNVSMSSAVRAGARAASASADAGPGICPGAPVICTPANAPAFAQGAADTMQTNGTAIPPGDIEWIMIYRAGSNGYPVGQSTLTCSVDCVVYRWKPEPSNPLGGRFYYSSGSWASASVNACLNDAGRHTVGVGMQVRHTWLTPIGSTLLGSATVMQDQTVMQFEPLEQDRCKPGTPNAHQ